MFYIEVGGKKYRSILSAKLWTANLVKFELRMGKFQKTNSKYQKAKKIQIPNLKYQI
ncbi:hypothetical protein J2X31_003324 [Flavobacterium arsenatis]|uniref:Arm DNA-binding domain-containing protein n=1 Tax=Flavobacterium arsenatis TaxID=1484332 RepID=A0ABU1TTT4_9FLAO|nr:hypothetical protein [Flavobacterium arsenatis]